MPPSRQSSAGLESNILLIEEYGALAAAIRSALKKFAPQHNVHVAKSLTAADKLAAQHRPGLLLIDIDPPLDGMLAFLTRMKALLPDAAVLIIGAGIPQDVLRVRSQPTALQFIEKPFQLTEFGETVQALLSLRDEDELRGSLRDLNLGDVLPLLCLEGATALLRVSEDENEPPGEVQFARGKIQSAAVRALPGVAALGEMLSWASPDFLIEEPPAEPTQPLPGVWSAIMRDALRAMPRRRPSRALLVPASPPRRKQGRKSKPPVARDGKKVLVIDDTETLRDFVEEVLSTVDPRMQIETAADATEGLARCGSFRPDLILLDYSLPDFNGDEVCRQLLESEEGRQIPVIMMSGHVAEMAGAAAQYRNVVLTLPKPFLSAALIDAVTNILAQPPVFNASKALVTESPVPAQLIAAEAPNLEPNPTEEIEEAPAQPEHRVPSSLESTPASTLPLKEPLTLEPATPRIPARAEPLLTPARIQPTKSKVVIVDIPLEVASMKFSPTLRITAIRARPCSPAVSLCVDPRAFPGARVTEIAFQIARVNLDERGQIQTMQVAPMPQPGNALRFATAVAIDRVVVLPPNGSEAFQLTPAAAAPMMIQLLMAFDIAGVELSPAFGISSLELTARHGQARVVMPTQIGENGLVFETARILLDRSARVAEILLDSVVLPAPVA